MSNVIVIIVLVVLLALSLSVIFYLFRKSKTQIKSKTTAFGLKDIGELATQAGFFTNVQTISNPLALLGIEIPLMDNKYIFGYDGVIKAGLNFKDIEVDVNEEQKSIVVRLPQTRILSIEIDEKSFRVFDERENIFNRLKLGDVNNALLALKEEIKATALKNGILENAQTNAMSLIKGFFIGAYGEDYVVEYREMR